jgi:acylphosphatase
MTCRQFKVSGRVQGVFFRASTRDIAVPLNIRGHAINLPDGSVEVLACGEGAALQQLERWLREGPPMATVDSVAVKEVECTAPEGFKTA